MNITNFYLLPLPSSLYLSLPLIGPLWNFGIEVIIETHIISTNIIATWFNKMNIIQSLVKTFGVFEQTLDQLTKNLAIL